LQPQESPFEQLRKIGFRTGWESDMGKPVGVADSTETAAVKQASDSSEGEAQQESGRYQIEYGKDLLSIPPAPGPDRHDASHHRAVDN